MANRPAPEHQVDEQLVADLLAAQHRDLADLPITLLERGWDNTNFRLGDDLIVRLPHRHAAAELIDNEQRWLPVLAPRLDIAIPAPVRKGVPTEEYPWPWSITPWFNGEVAALAPFSDPAAEATRLGEFFAALHQPAPDDGPVNPYRGGPLADRAEIFAKRLSSLEADFDPEGLKAVFERGLQAPAGTEHVWLHGDLHARNVIVAGGKIAAIIDWGDIAVGEPACDLAGAFMLVPDHIEQVATAALETEAAWERARGWAVDFGVMYLVFGDDDDVMGLIGTRLLTTLVESI